MVNGRVEVKIRVENYYTDGHESVCEYEIPDERVANLSVPDLEETLYEWTGDGHGAKFPKLGSCHTVTVLEAADPSLIGKEFNEYGL
jgi:hypothetical protein